MRIIPVLIISVLLLASCSGLKITQTVDEEADFTKYKTFFIMPPDPALDIHVNRYDKELLLRSIADEMKGRGYVQQEANGDLSVNLFLIVNDETGVTNYNTYYVSGGWGYYYPFGYGSASGNYMYTVTKGTLLIDVFDHHGKKLIWQGVGIGTIKDDQIERQKNIPKVVDKIFWGYPIKEGVKK